MNTSNIILIGMAATGKSTIGKQLAERLDWAFVDTDQLLEAWWGAPLQAVNDYLGRDGFIRAEAEQILRIKLNRCIIATGGSVVYDDAAMLHLKHLGRIVYLQASFASISRRLTNPTSRGLAISAGQTLQDLYEEREPLYARHAQTVVDSDDPDIDRICSLILADLSLSDQESL